MTIKNVIFDWDGTLAKTLDLWLEGYQLAFGNRGYHFAPEFIANEFFHNHHEVPHRHPDIPFPPIADDARAHVLEGLSTVKLYENAAHTLGALQNAGVTLTLVTSSARNLLDRAFSAHNLAEYFDSIITGDDGFGHKPSPLPFKATLERIGSSASETISIGDSSVDIQAGKSVGCRTCWFAPDHNQLFHNFDTIRSLEPSHTITSMSDLIDIIEA